ncbi:MAG: sigma-54 dependent transcriptional regulator [bacterium]
MNTPPQNPKTPAEITRVSILIVDDDDSMRDILSSVLHSNYKVTAVATGEAGLRALKQQHVDIVLLDICLPDTNGLEVLREIKNTWPETLVIMITVVKEIKSAVTAMQLGAFDYINKEFDYDELRTLIARAVGELKSHREISYLREEVAQRVPQEFIIGATEAMQKTCELMRKAAAVPSTVLITGESGTGKEMVARQIHKWSDRVENPFMAINLASIPSELLESILFGHEKGAFTGAHCQRSGKFELANGGTLFLDEISELRFDLQAKLLRAIQEGEVERVGGAHPIPIDLRLIAATNIDLQAAVKNGGFREDLFYRLNVLPIHLPPLRERRSDIPELIGLFLNRYSKRFHRIIGGITEEAREILCSYNWPGNIRELENLVERMVALADGNMLTIYDVPVEYRVFPFPFAAGQFKMTDALRLAVEGFERAFIIQALKQESWHQGKTAERLGVHRKTLEYKIKRLKILRGPSSEE